MNKIIYVVSGHCGEYSDSRDWLVKAFTDRIKAYNHVTELSRISQELYAKYDEDYTWPDDYYLDPGELAMNQIHLLDSNFQHYYTGTNYTVEELELEEE